MPDPLLELREVRAGYAEAVVLDGVSLALPASGSLAVLGRNGMGKTTLLLAIMGFVTLARGSIWLKGTDISRLPPHKRAHVGVGWVPQERDIFPSLTVQENLTVAARPGRWDLEAVFALFPRLKERRANMGNQLSGGEQQMLTIARTLMTNPSVLLLDEPAAGVPKDESAMLFSVLAALPEEISVLFIEHDMDIVFSFASRVIVMVAGAVLLEAEPAVVSQDPRVREVYLGTKNTTNAPPNVTGHHA